MQVAKPAAVLRHPHPAGMEPALARQAAACLLDSRHLPRTLSLPPPQSQAGMHSSRKQVPARPNGGLRGLLLLLLPQVAAVVALAGRARGGGWAPEPVRPFS